ncbi:MAG: AMP-binding protein, partial [Pseudobutyrivibrio sp.]|nr:AMP-binding protein [Pseudobutyrivibrio sp.]
GTSVMKGYFEMPSETRAVFTDGWLHTGDKGYIDEDGYLFINGRVKNLIIMSNGENISPEEIENKVALNPLVSEVIISGNNTGLTAHTYPDMDYAQRKLMAPADINRTLQDFIDKYNKAQPSYRHITSLVIRSEPFIRNTTGKIKRTEIA